MWHNGNGSSCKSAAPQNGLPSRTARSPADPSGSTTRSVPRMPADPLSAPDLARGACNLRMGVGKCGLGVRVFSSAYFQSALGSDLQLHGGSYGIIEKEKEKEGEIDRSLQGCFVLGGASQSTASPPAVLFGVRGSTYGPLNHACCVKYTRKPLPFGLIKGYIEQSSLEVCRIDAIIFFTKHNKKVCASVKDEWVRETLARLSRVILNPFHVRCIFTCLPVREMTFLRLSSSLTGRRIRTTSLWSWIAFSLRGAIKLENFVITGDTLDLKLVDFGCAELLQKSAYKTFTGMSDITICTRDYACHEFFQTGEYYGKPAMVFSLGVLLFAMLCGKFPICYERSLINERICYKDGLTEECCHLIEDCLQEDPDKRIRLEKIFEHKWIQVRSTKRTTGWSEEEMEDEENLVVIIQEINWCQYEIGQKLGDNGLEQSMGNLCAGCLEVDQVAVKFVKKT
ncbi:Testis-specific serine/threonine-protein kinase 5 [Triplophysa tibetana]|uniref:non-specific serine/threonine protein kinase n=1 Tax=Triplophysa tibetana TaxID=1572043 RepID=A0A5A9P8H3_9TELE|nr:Testis-specific serine/threonine-protein kinase 5 [Triplophysa tibetana]